VPLIWSILIVALLDVGQAAVRGSQDGILGNRFEHSDFGIQKLSKSAGRGTEGSSFSGATAAPTLWLPLEPDPEPPV